ncbi:cell wall protein Ecm33 [Gnomoniopsis smithogilvyi]|uniref:Cell wall protein Ecm33 n=1 Tax=Gnomoniopsis smithogilvyi TaxID=1191159 RepID=A0A9W8YWD0_9PEZI|nr:cell wall protein Ecm33 [Gnomoniopsis smithogilvyi]
MLSTLLLYLAALSPGLVTAAESKVSCSSATFTVNSAADATALSQCSTLFGDVQIGPDVTSINLSGPVSITGDLRLDNGIVISLASDSIATIAGTLAINNATILSTLALRNLTSVGSLQMQTVPSLSELGFDRGITSAKSVYIEDTGFLSSLDGLAFTQIVDITLAQNLRLNSVDLPLVNATGVLKFVENGQSLKVNLPDLTTVNELSISNVTQIQVPALQTILGTGTIDTSYFTTFSAPVLRSCGDGLSIVNNPELRSILLPELSSVTGSLLVANNSDLTKIDGFSKLETISEDVELVGDFYDVALPDVVNVGGNLFVSSRFNITESCAALQHLAPVSQGGGGQVHGNFTCLSNNKNVVPESLVSSSTTYFSTSISTFSNSSAQTTGPMATSTTPTSTLTPTPSSSGSQTRSETSKCGVYLSILILAILR